MRPTVYSIVHDGREIRSLYRELYRLRYRFFLAGRGHDVDKLTTADDEHQARAQASGDVRGAVTVEHVATLTREEE